jgi:CBS domain containing-hemolysin-like protein
MNPYLIILITLLFSAFFSGMEIAFVSANRLRIELDKKQGLLSARIISLFSRQPAQYIVSMLIGNNVVLVIYGIYMAILLRPLLAHFISSDSAILILQTIVSTIIILITGEFLPKLIFRTRSNLLLNLFSIPVLFFYILFLPITFFAIGFSNFVLKFIFRTHINQQMNPTLFGKVDLDHLVGESMVESDTNPEMDHNIRIFQNALDFANVKVRECMIPRTEIIALEEGTTINELKKTFIETGLSKILIYRDSVDQVIGYVHAKDLFRNPRSIKTRLVSLSVVPETMPANKLLETLMAEKKSIALVVDEFGGTSGLVTTEDILEEIFGEIEDEHDIPMLVDKKISETEYIFSGRLEIDNINEKYHLNLPESDEYKTVAGYILLHHTNIPQLNEVIVIGNFQFKVLKVSRTRLDLVKLAVLQS